MRERDNARQSLIKNMPETEDEFKSFGNHIEHVLKNLPTRLLQIKAKKEIFEVITKYEIMAEEYSTISSSTTPSSSRTGAITSISDDSHYTNINIYSPVSRFSEPTDLSYTRNAEFGITSELNDLTYAPNAEFSSIVSEANNLIHQTANEEFSSI